MHYSGDLSAKLLSYHCQICLKVDIYKHTRHYIMLLQAIGHHVKVFWIQSVEARMKGNVSQGL